MVYHLILNCRQIHLAEWFKYSHCLLYTFGRVRKNEEKKKKKKKNLKRKTDEGSLAL